MHASLVYLSLVSRLVSCSLQTTSSQQIGIKVAGAAAISGTTIDLREAWEETAFQLERLQVGCEALCYAVLLLFAG